MTDSIYYCEKKNNSCPKREECNRYVYSDDREYKATLYKAACTENNAYVLFVKRGD